MNGYDVKRLALILAVQAEIEGAKAENKQREVIGHSMAYDESQFAYLAEELRQISSRPDELL